MSKDYLQTYLPTHSHARSNGCVRNHILIAEEILQRPLKKGEYVHHKDKNKTNNAKNNLMIFKTNADHARYHTSYNKLILLKDGTYICTEKYNSVCPICGKKKNNSSKICLECYNIKKSSHIPSKDILEKIIWEKPTIQIAKDFNVSDKAIEKWCKKYGIKKPPRGYWMKQKHLQG